MKRAPWILGILFASFAQAQDMFGDDKRAFVLMPAEVISSGIVDRVQISATGQFVVYQKMTLLSFDGLLSGKEQPPTPSWYSYDRKIKSSKKLPVPDVATSVYILGDGTNAFFHGHEKNDPQGFVNLRSGTITPTSIEIRSIRYLGDLPDASFLIVGSDETSPLQIVRPNGATVPLNLPPKVLLSTPLEANPKGVTFTAYIRSKPIEFGLVSLRYSDGDVSFKSITQQQWQEAVMGNKKLGQFWYEATAGVMNIQLAERPKDLKTDVPAKAKLALANCQPQIALNSEFVVYQDGGALLTRDIKPIDYEAAKKMAAAALKSKLISDAKQAALALIMYAGDMDDVLPGAEGWEAKVMPYSKDSDLLKSFNYTFRGGNMAMVDNPASTELGFIMGPGGRAVAYLDGHVKWIPNP